MLDYKIDNISFLQVGQQLSNDLYCCGWETWHDPTTTQLITIMIAYAQKPLVITAKGIFVINVELFVSIVKAAYSLYTIIRE